MNNEGKVGLFEAICLVTLFISNKVFYSSLAGIVRASGTAAWYVTLISCSVSLIFFYFLYTLIKRFPEKDLIQIFEAVLGRFFGKFLAFLVCAYGIYYSGTNLREFVEMLKAYNLPLTPTSLIMAAVLITAIILSYNGFESIARISAICLMPIIICVILILLLASPSYNFNLLKPYGGYGLGVTLSTGFLRSSAYVEFTVLAILAKAVQGRKELKKIGLISILLSALIFSSVTFFYLANFGHGAGGESVSGMFELSRTIYYNRFFQRIESIFLFTWVISSVVATTIAFYTAALTYCKTFRIKSHKPLLLPFALLVFIVAILPENLQEVININVAFLRQYSVFILYIPITFVLLISLIFKKKGDKQNA